MAIAKPKTKKLFTVDVDYYFGYEDLIDPDGICIATLTEPENRSFGRDLNSVIDLLNTLHQKVSDQEWAMEAGSDVHRKLAEEHKRLQNIVHGGVIPMIEHALKLGHLGEGSTQQWAKDILKNLEDYLKVREDKV